MGNVGGVATRVFGILVRRRDAVRILGWRCNFAAVDRGGHDADGPQHGDGDPGAGNRYHDYGDRDPEHQSKRVSFEAPDVLGGIALIGLLTYALLRGMDATIAGMLTGLFGVLLGRSTKSNGKK